MDSAVNAIRGSRLRRTIEMGCLWIPGSRRENYDGAMNAKTANAPCLRFSAATAADIPRVVSLVNSAYSVETFLKGTRTDDELLAAMMRKGRILIAEDDSGRLLACVYIEVRGPRGYMGLLAVDPAHQGSGLARRTVQAAEDHLRDEGCVAVDIVVLSLRPELLPIYRRFGYIESGILEEFRPTRQLAPGFECHGIKMSKQL
jgi:ribosomal protein S18 acetylase RimI-like enzyme